jgi:hypothetical protein
MGMGPHRGQKTRKNEKKEKKKEMPVTLAPTPAKGRGPATARMEDAEEEALAARV